MYNEGFFINEYGMKEILRDNASMRGIDLSTVKVCECLRKLAALDRLKIDESTYRSNLNKHLLNYIEYCGMSVKEYIKQYLTNLQPYMIERNKDGEYNKGIICVLDNLYKVSLYIKADSTFGDEAIISFHESSINGIAKENSVIGNKAERYVPVFAD